MKSFIVYCFVVSFPLLLAGILKDGIAVLILTGVGLVSWCLLASQIADELTKGNNGK